MRLLADHGKGAIGLLAIGHGLSGSVSIPSPITITTLPTLGALTSGQQVSAALSLGAATSTEGGGATTPTANVQINGSPALVTDTVAETDVVSITVTYTDNASPANSRTASAGTVTVPYVAPTALGAIADQTFTVGAAVASLDVSGDFTGTSLTYALAPTSGALPDGLSLSSAGIISGTPTAFTASRSIVVRASTPDGQTVDSAFGASVRDVPDQISDLSSVAGELQVALTWSAPAANGATITGYTLQSRTGVNAFATIYTGATPSFTDTGLTAGTAIDYRVLATNAAGSGPYSAIATATPTAAAATGSITETKYTYTGSNQTVTVPSGISTVYAALAGAGGGTGCYNDGRNGGGGGFTELALAVFAGDTITIQVAQGGGEARPGGTGRTDGAATAGYGGWPDGGGGSFGDGPGGGGGGSTRLWLNGVLQAVAGGGGADAGFSGNGGPGGGLAGGDATETNAGTNVGTGGTQSSGGFDGTSPLSTPKQGLQITSMTPARTGGWGGITENLTESTTDDGGGGGGGYWGGGGGGGDAHAAGGGSGYLNAGLTGQTYQGSGRIPPAAAQSIPLYASGEGFGAQSRSLRAPGGDGFLILSDAPIEHIYDTNQDVRYEGPTHPAADRFTFQTKHRRNTQDRTEVLYETESSIFIYYRSNNLIRFEFNVGTQLYRADTVDTFLVGDLVEIDFDADFGSTPSVSVTINGSSPALNVLNAPATGTTLADRANRALHSSTDGADQFTADVNLEYMRVSYDGGTTWFFEIDVKQQTLDELNAGNNLGTGVFALTGTWIAGT